MALKIFTTGSEQYSPGGTGRVKVMVIGGPGAGKTRWSSYFPKPIYLDCEGGLASVADRKVQFAPIKNSQDMLDALVFLKQESSRPHPDRSFNTVVVDTLDAFQRKVKDEWLLAHPQEESFRGFEAWGYLDTKMQMLSTRLLNLDMNVIVLVHYSEKTISEGIGDNKTERQEYQLQLSGAFKEQVFNDFDLVGWMGTYFELDSDSQKREQRRGITFKPTPAKPFLKDRLHVTPEWLEVDFAPTDYEQLFSAVASRLEEMTPTTEFGEIPTAVLDGQALPGAGQAPPLPGGGALPASDPREVPLAQYDKPTLQKRARELGIEFKGNTLKGELIVAIEAKLAEQSAPKTEEVKGLPAEEKPEDKAEGKPAEEATSEAPSASPSETPAPAPEGVTPEEAGDLAAQTLASYRGGSRAEPETDKPSGTPPASPAAASAASAPVEPGAAPAPEPAAPVRDEDAVDPKTVPLFADDSIAGGTIQTSDSGPVDLKTGEATGPATTEEAIETIEAQLGGATVVSDVVKVDAPVQPAPADTTAAKCPNGQDNCGGICREDDKRTPQGVTADMTFVCDQPIGPNPDFIKLSFIKYRKHLCNAHYMTRKNG